MNRTTHVESRTRTAQAAMLATILAPILALESCAQFKAIEREAAVIKAMKIENVDLAAVADGEYEWNEDRLLDTARVRVSVRGGRIESIVVLEHKHGPGKKRSAAGLADLVVARQSLDVDMVSGATSSSKVMLKAIESALRQGLWRIQ